MWLPTMFSSEYNHGALFLCLNCGEKNHLPMPHEEAFNNFVNEKVTKEGAKCCGSKNYLFKDYRGKIYSVDYKIN